MSVAAPPPRSPAPRGQWPRWTEDRAGDRMRRVSVPVGLAVTVLVHLLAYSVFPWDEIGFIESEKPKPNPPLEVEFLPPPPPPPPKFVQTNPVAPEEKPEETENIAAQDQVAAQEEPDSLSDADAPRVEGELLDSQNIVQGDITAEMGPPSPEIMSEPSPALPPAPPAEEAPPSEAEPTEATAEAEPAEEPAEESRPADEASYVDAETSEAEPGVEAVKAVLVEEAPTEEEGFKAAPEVAEAAIEAEETIEETAQPERGESDRVEVVMEEAPISATRPNVPSTEPRPQARPRLNFKVSSGPLKNQPRSTSRMGAVAVDANFDKFGAYLQRMVESIDLQWQILARQSSTIMAELGSRVVIRFSINQQGEITQMEVLFSSASRSGTVMCLNAIESRAPFGVWTEEMARTLGKEETITFSFYYR